MSFMLTTEQKMATEKLDNNILVSASAGSGKTKVLISRIKHILQNKYANLKEILVMTFTNNAAMEMRQRLKKELLDSNNFTSELNELETADIFTIHSFCQKTIKEFCSESGVSPNFSILDDQESDFLKMNALDIVLQNHYEKSDDNFLRVYESFNERRSDEQLKLLLISIYKFLRSKQNYKDWAYNSIANTYNENINENRAINYFNNYLLQTVNYFGSKFGLLLFEAEQLKSTNLTNYAKAYLNHTFQFNQNIKNNIDILFCEDTLPNINGKTSVEEIELKEKLQEISKLYKVELRNFVSLLGNDGLQDNLSSLENVKNMLKNILNLVFEFENEYDRLKHIKQVMDFDDMQHFCLQTLQNKKIRDVLKSRYKFILIDEYQDTSDIQEEIINLIIRDNNLFMVGDIKQSIYMFRQCKPQIFIDKYHMFKNKFSCGEIIELNKNFRSEKAILDFSNWLFNSIMLEQTAQLNYSKNSQFVFDNTKSNENKTDGIVEIKLLKLEQEEKITKPLDNVYDLQNDELVCDDKTTLKKECLIIASVIKEKLQQKIFDNSTNNFRSVKFGDIAILTRKKENTIDLIKQELELLDIPINVEFEYDLYNKIEVQLLHNFLKLIDNEMQDIPLASVLNSFVANVNENELAQIRLEYPSEKFFHLAVKKYAVEKNNETSKKLKKLFDEINNFKSKKAYLNISELMNEIVNYYNFETEVLKAGLAENNEDIRIAVTNSLALSHQTLFQYLKYVDDFANENTIKRNVGTSENAVTLSTIHASKGLEYPIVILANTNVLFSNKSTMSKIILNNDFGFGLNNYDAESRQVKNNIAKSAIKLKIKEQEKQEEMRLLYVALTRAKINLILTGAVKPDDIKTLKNFYEINSANNCLSWILGNLNKTEIECLKNKNRLEVEFNKSKFKFELIEVSEMKICDVAIDETQKLIKPITNEHNFFQILNEKQQENPLVLKNTVTAITNDEIENDVLHHYLSIKTEDEDFSLIGTAYHKVMQYVNIQQAEINLVKADIEKMVEQNILLQEEVALVNIDKIRLAIENISKFIDGAEILREKPFLVYLPANELIKSEYSDKLLVQGVVDLIIKKHDEIVVIDFKTSRIKDEEKLKQKYQTQLNLYALAIEKFYKIKVTKKIIYSFFLDRLVIVWQALNLKFIIS